MLNQEEEAKIQEMKDKCRELSVPPPPDILIGLQVHDKNGILVFDDVQRGHSWTRNFYNMMFGMIAGARGNNTSSFGAGYMSGKNTAGSIYAAYNYSSSYQNAYSSGYFNSSTSSSYGIVVGSGDTAFDKDQNALASIINHGSNTGQLFYHASPSYTTSNIPTYTSSPKAWQQQHLRVFNNNSGGSITVKETALYVNAYLFSGSPINIMVERSILDPTVPVANGAQLTVTYTISMDYSSID